MTPICTCGRPDIDRTTHKEPFCRKCGYWWNPKYGSHVPVPGEKSRSDSHWPKRISGNDYCPCGSEKKYKNCCGKSKSLEPIPEPSRVKCKSCGQDIHESHFAGVVGGDFYCDAELCVFALAVRLPKEEAPGEPLTEPENQAL